MKKIYITYVNTIMTVDKSLVSTPYYKRNETNVIAEEKMLLKSYKPEDNVLWGPYERQRRFNDFYRDNRGLVGAGETILISNDNGTLTEYYSGLEVVPVMSHHQETTGSNFGDASYYSVPDEIDPTKLYVPIAWLSEVDQYDALAVIEKLFSDRQRDVTNEIIKPLQNRQQLVKKKYDSQLSNNNDDTNSNYIDEVPIRHTR